MFKQSDEKIIESFYNLQSRNDVAQILEVKDKSLRYYLYGIHPINMYSTFEVKKKNGTAREICSPNTALKNIQRKFAYILELVYKPKICAYGFIKDKNIYENASNHIKKNIILNIDLKDFFTQINFGRIRGMLMSKPYCLGEEAATVISQLACYNGYLPQGAPSSPVLTNMICVPLDNALMRLAKKQKIIYTRYADDLSFSTYSASFSSDIVNIRNGKPVLGEELSDIINRNGFIVNSAKIHLKHKNSRQEVTGIIVNKFLNVKREYVKNLRAILYNCETKGTYETAIEYINRGFCNNKDIIEQYKDSSKIDFIVEWFSCVIKGKIDYIKQVKGNNSMTYLSFAKKANEIFGKPLFDISILTTLNDMIRKNVFILEYNSETEYIQGSGFFVQDMGLITSNHVTQSSNFFHVYTASSYSEQERITTISKGLNEISSDENIDYAIYNVNITNTASIKCGDSTQLKIGDKVIIAGYPDFNEGDSITVQSCEIIGIKENFLGSMFYKVSGRIVHGLSGGIVLNSSNEVVGIIKGGVCSISDEDSTDNQGFVPIHLVIDHFKTNRIS